MTVRRHHTHSRSLYVKSKLTPSLGRRISAESRQSLGKIQQKVSGLSPVTTSSDKGMGQSSSPVPRPVLHHISSHCPQQSDAALLPHCNTDSVATYRPKPSLFRGRGCRSDKSAREHPWRETRKHEVYLLYASKNPPHLQRNPPFVFALAPHLNPARRVAGTDPAPHPAAPQLRPERLWLIFQWPC